MPWVTGQESGEGRIYGDDAEVKAELAQVAVSSASARRAEVVSLLRVAEALRIISGRVLVEAEIDCQGVVVRLRKNIHALFGYDAMVRAVSVGGVGEHTRFVVRVGRDGAALARRSGLLDVRGRPVRGLPAQVVGGGLADLEAVWRGAFLARGSLSEPTRSPALVVDCLGLEG